MKSFVFPLVVGMCSVVLAGCGKDPPKKPVDTHPATPIPSDMVFNDFVPTTGGNGVVGVKVDGGIPEGGMAAAEGTGSTEPGAGGAPDESSKLKVTEPGAEPRAARKYAFVANRSDKRILTIKQPVGA